MKRTLILVVSLLVLIGLAALSCATAETSGVCGDELTWTLTDAGVLTISGTGKMTSHPWDAADVRKVIINEGASNVGKSAFYGCESLTSITLPESITEIGDSAFRFCSSLKHIALPDAVTIIDEFAFDDCTSLTSIELGSHITSVGVYAFSDCESLPSIELPDGVTSIGDDAFKNCKSLTSLAIPNGVTEIEMWTFQGCDGLQTIFLPDSLTKIDGWAIGMCENLTSIQVSAYNEALTSIGGVLFSKDKKELLAYPRGSSGAYTIPSGVTSIGEAAFNHCANLTGIEVPDGVTTIGYCAFTGCKRLKRLVLPESVTSIDRYAFQSCTGLTSFVIPSGITEIRYCTFEHCTSLESVTIPEGVTRIVDAAFNGCSSLTSVTIPRSVLSIGDTTFQGCSSLTEAVFLNAQTKFDVYEVACSYVFNECSEDLTIRGWSGSTAETYAKAMGITFVPFSPEPTFTLPASLTRIEANAFSYIAAEAVVIPKTVTYISGNPFAGSTVLYIYGFEGSSAEALADSYPDQFTFIPVDDDWMDGH